MKAFSAFLGVIFTLSFFGWVSTRTVNAIMFDRGCSGYLKLAADSNSVELAKANLVKAIAYIEKEQMTTGFTSVLYKTPRDDVGFWYQNIKASLDELNKLNPEAAPLEKTNVLMKLRETLLDQDKDGTKVTAPDGITIYPANGLFFVWGTMSFVLMIVCFGIAGSND